jgi:hypothetical protein
MFDSLKVLSSVIFLMPVYALIDVVAKYIYIKVKRLPSPQIESQHGCCKKVVIYIKKLYDTTIVDSFRWFFLHAIINWILTILILPNVKYCLTHITHCASEPWINGVAVTALGTSLHLYHMIAFKKLTTDDYIHHILFAVINVPIILMYNKTVLAMFGAFFLLGLPGAIDYSLLVLTKLDLFDSQLEKKIYIYISLYLRMPGCIFSTILQLIYLTHAHLTLPHQLALVWNASIAYWNGIYFMHDTLKNYYMKQKRLE